ncbi:MAG: hypothetical protein IJF32_11385 [Oscillospiraceae bacterium]|nr:hypothetical protein [Oscillospiraceae bacterium]
MKKLLSIILAAAMLLSLVPSVFAVEGETAEPIVYDLTTGSFDMDSLFNYATVPDNTTATTYDAIDPVTGETVNRKAANGRWGTSYIYNPDLLTWDKVITTSAEGKKVEAFSALKGDVPQWKFEYGNALGNVILSSSNLRMDFKKNTLKEADTSFALRIKVPTPGKYDIMLDSESANEYGGQANVYLVKAEEEKDYTSADLEAITTNILGVYISDDSVYGHGSMTAKAQTLEAGEYLLVFAPYKLSNLGADYSRCFISSITLTPHDETAVETEVPFSLPQKILHEGETLTLEGVPYGAVLSSSAPDILTVNAKGEVIGKAMGKVTVTADVNGTKQSIEIPVVGENKLSAKNAYFENGLYHSTYGTGAADSATPWEYGGLNKSSAVSKAYDITTTTASGLELPGRTEPVNGLKIVKNDCRTYVTMDTGTAEDLNGDIAAEEGKIYEFTGWTKLDKRDGYVLPDYTRTSVALVTYYMNTSSKPANKAGGNVSVWADGDYTTADETTGWKYFTSGSRLQNYANLNLTDESNVVNLVPRFVLNYETTVENTGMEAYLTEFSVHEVVFDELVLSAENVELKAGSETENTATVTVEACNSNTGSQIKNFNGDIVTGTPSFKSNNTAVATVDEATGVINAVGAGSTTVEVSTTIGGVTKTAEVKVIVDGGEDKVPETVTAGVLTNYEAAASGVTAAGYTVNNTKDVVTGTKITAEAKDTTDYKFICWKVGGAFLQTDAKVENYVVNTNTSLTAVYEPINTELKIVEFWNANKQFLSMDDDNDGEITEPTAPAVTGFTLTGKWLVDEGKYLDVNSLEVGTTRAVAEVEEGNTAVSGEVKYDGTKVSEEHTYGTKVTRTASGAKYWTRDGKTVFFGDTYTYFMWDGTEIEAHTDEKELEPVIILDDPANGAYMIEYCVPQGFEKVEAGILFAKSGTPEVTGFGSKAASQSADAHGQFTAQADADEKVVRGYLIYQVDGEKKIIYTDVYTATAE